MILRLACWAATAFMVSADYAVLQPLITDDSAMTLYVSDEDYAGKSSCYAECTRRWAPYTGSESDAKGKPWSLVNRDGGAQQWAYDGKPTYRYFGDRKPGDTAGDGKEGVWHALRGSHLVVPSSPYVDRAPQPS